MAKLMVFGEKRFCLGEITLLPSSLADFATLPYRCCDRVEEDGEEEAEEELMCRSGRVAKELLLTHLYSLAF